MKTEQEIYMDAVSMHNERGKQLKKLLMKLRRELVERPDTKKKGEYRKVDFDQKLTKEYEKWRKKMKTSLGKWEFADMEEKKRRHQVNMIKLMADRLDTLNHIQLNGLATNPVIKAVIEEMKKSADPLPESVFDYLGKNEAYIKLHEYIDFLKESKIDRNSEKQIERDIAFLREIKEKFESAREKRDATLYDYGYKLINDWIDELGELL